MNHLFHILLFIAALSFPVASFGQVRQPACCQGDSISRSVLIIYYQDSAARKRLRKALKKLHCETLYTYHNFDALAVSIPHGANGANGLDIARQLRKIRGVISVEPDRILQLN